MFVVGPGLAQKLSAQTISSTLNGKTGVIENRWTEFTASVTEGPDFGRSVTQRLTLDDATQAAYITLEYKDASNNWQPLSFTNGVVMFGPSSGFPLADATTSFRVKISTPGEYGYKLEINDATTNEQLAVSDEEVDVEPYVAPTIASTLNEKKNVQPNQWVAYDVTTTAGTDANAMVRGRLVLDDETQAANITAEYKDENNDWQPLLFSTGGLVWFGPSTGFPLMDATSYFRVMFDAEGLYTYKLQLVEITTDSLMASADEFVEVMMPAPVKPTIASTLNNMGNITPGREVNFNVTTTTGDMANTLVKGYITLADSTQASNISVSYTDGNNWFPLTFNNGIIEFGPSTGFPLMNASSAFRVTFSDAGTYNYMLDIVDVNSGDTLATAMESVMVDPFVAPTISSTLNNRSNVTVNAEQSFDVTTVAGTDVNRMVNARLVLKDATQAGNITASYFDGTNWMPLTFNNGIIEFGPTTGFPLMDATSSFRITFGDTGTYAYSLEILDASTSAFLAWTEEEVVVNDVVYVAPTVSSTLNNMSNVVATREVDFSVSTVANSEENTIVKGYITLADPTQASNISVSYTDGMNWMPLTFNNGIIEFGPATGFPLMNAISDFRVTFANAGTYSYMIDIVEVATGDTLATAMETVTVATFVNATISSTLNNRNGVLINNQASFSVTTAAGSESNRMVKGRIVLANAAQASDITLSYFDGMNWQPLSFSNGVAEFGPATGFPLSNASTNFRVTFASAGTYAYTLEIVDVNTNQVLANSNEQVVVNTATVMPTISSTLNNKTGIIANRQTTFTINPVTGTEAGRMVRIRWVFDNLAMGAFVDAEYQDENGDWQRVFFINGSAIIGPAAGFMLSSAPINVRATFTRDGEYYYNFEIRNVATNQPIANVDERVNVGVNSIGEKDGAAVQFNVYPNPAVSNLTIALPATGTSQVTIFTVNGKQIRQMNNVNGLQTLDVSHLANGIYLVKVVNNGVTATKRFEILK